MELDSVGLVLRALKLIEDVKKTASQVAVHRADFLMMAYYLVEVRPLLEELNEQQEFLLTHPTWPSLQLFTNVVEGMNTFTKACASKSKIYLICHSHDLIQEMTKRFKQLGECVSAILSESSEILPRSQDVIIETQRKLGSPNFFQEPGDIQLAQDIKSALKEVQSGDSADEHEQQKRASNLLQKIVNHMNLQVSEILDLKLELQQDLTAAESERRQDDIQELKELCALLNSAELFNNRSIPEYLDPIPHHSANVWEIPKSFYCPITKEVMREPVMVGQGHTYERAAILEWFQRGNKTCPDTGQELQSLELTPNMTLQHAMNEYFSKMHRQHLVLSLQALKSESTPEKVEVTINTIRDILNLDSEYKRLLVSWDGIEPLLSVLKSSSTQVREKILRILYNISRLGDLYKKSIVEAGAIRMLLKTLQRNPEEKPGPLQLLWELSKCEMASRAILAVEGSVIIIASACNLCQNDQKLLAEKLLENLCRYDESVIIEAARSSIFGPLISSLSSGDDELKLKMATAILESLDLNEHSSLALVKVRVIPPLLHLLQHGTPESKKAAGKVLHQLSMIDASKSVFANEGAIPILVELLDTPLPQLKLDILAVLSNLATNRQIAAEIDREGAITHHLGLLFSGDSVMQEYSLKTFECLARDSQAVRLSMVSLVPNIYRLLQEEDLSSICRRSVLGVLCLLAEDALTQGSLMTSSDMVRFLIDLLEGCAAVEDKETVMSLFAGLSKVEGMKSKLVAEIQLLLACTGYMKLHNSHKLRESTAAVLSQLCDPALTAPTTLVSLSRQGLISTLMETLSSNISTDGAKAYAMMVLSHFSRCTPVLTRRQSFLKQLMARLGMKRFRNCDVHGGKCSVRGTCCVVEAGAVPLLVNMIKEGGPQSSEQALEVLATLIVNKQNTSGVADCFVKNGVIPSLVSVVGRSSQSTEKATKLMEVIFRVRRYRDERYSKVAKMSLATVLATGTAEARRAAGIALMHLKAVPKDSAYSTFTTTN